MNHSLFTILAAAFFIGPMAHAETTPIRIQDLTATEERGLSPEQVQQEFATTAGTTYPNAIISGNAPNVYTSSNHPYSVTAGSIPNALTSGNFPEQYTIGRLLDQKKIEEVPMPRLNF